MKPRPVTNLGPIGGAPDPTTAPEVATGVRKLSTDQGYSQAKQHECVACAHLLDRLSGCQCCSALDATRSSLVRQQCVCTKGKSRVRLSRFTLLGNDPTLRGLHPLYLTPLPNGPFPWCPPDWYRSQRTPTGHTTLGGEIAPALTHHARLSLQQNWSLFYPDIHSHGLDRPTARTRQA